MEKFTFITINEKEVVIEKFNYLDTCVNLMKKKKKKEEEIRKRFGIKDKKYMCITNENGKILAEWISKE